LLKFVIFALPCLRMSLNPLLLFALTWSTLQKKKDRKHFNVYKCVNDRCSFYLNSLKTFPDDFAEYQHDNLNLSFVISIENSLQISLK
jgi:hypothetical protein